MMPVAALMSILGNVDQLTIETVTGIRPQALRRFLKGRKGKELAMAAENNSNNDGDGDSDSDNCPDEQQLARMLLE